MISPTRRNRKLRVPDPSQPHRKQLTDRVPHPSRCHRDGWERLLLAPSVLLCLAITSSARAQELQSWNEVDLAAAWRRIDLVAPFVARTDPSLPNPQLAATGLTADFHLSPGLALTPGYLFVDLPQPAYLVHVPLLALTETLHTKRLTMADRNRLEGLIRYPGNPVRYRNRLLLDLPLGAQARAHLFLDDELFVVLSPWSFNQNRLQTGAGYHLTRHLLLDLYYLQKNPATGPPTRVFGSTLRITLTQPIAHLTPTHNP